MIFTTILLRRILMLNYCSLIQTVWLTKPENVYEDFFKWKDLFDFSNYSKDSRFFDNANKKAIGKMKDEYGGVNIDQLIGLKYVLNKKNRW